MTRNQTLAKEIIDNLVKLEIRRAFLYQKNVMIDDGGTEVETLKVVAKLTNLLQGEELDPYNPPEKCPTCKRNLKATWMQLSKKQVRFLLQMKAKALELGKNDIGIGVAEWPELTKVQYANVSPLRRFGLVAHVRDDQKRKVQGHWLITRNGWAFMRGDYKVAKKVLVWLDRTIEKSIETMSLREILISDIIPEWTSKDDILAGYTAPPPEQISLLNES